MITLIYPEGDWTAAEVVIKMQALAASQGYKVYVTPKNTRRDEEHIKLQLRKTVYAIFTAIDKRDVDENSLWELKFLHKNDVVIYYAVPGGFHLPEGLYKRKNVFYFSRDDPEEIIKSLDDILAKIKKEAREESYKKGTGTTESGYAAESAAILVALLGLLLLFIYLIFRRK